MTIAFRSAGSAAFGINAFTPGAPAGQLAGDMMILWAACKPGGASSIGNITNWTPIDAGANTGSNAAGTDIGSMHGRVFYREATADTESMPSVIESGSWNVAGAVVLCFSKGAGETWEAPVLGWGADVTDGTTIAGTSGGVPDTAAGDFLVLLAGVNSDLLVPFTTDLSVTQSGATFSAFTERVESESTTGGDMGLHATTGSVITGGTGTHTFAAVGTSSSAGLDEVIMAVVRLRVAAGPSSSFIPVIGSPGLS
jgi:hypothetical protein